MSDRVRSIDIVHAIREGRQIGMSTAEIAGMLDIPLAEVRAIIDVHVITRTPFEPGPAHVCEEDR